MKHGLVFGFFDGVHIAHQAVIKSAFEYSDRVTVLTFKDSPAKFFGKNIEYICSRQNSIQKIKDMGVNEIVELDFSSIAGMSAKDYLSFVINKYSPTSISTGFNHTFGKNKEGNVEFLQSYAEQYGYKYVCVPKQIYNGEVISSTLVRKLLKNGEIEQANKILGSNFILEGIVIKGNQIGRTIGFPTANINYPDEIVKIPYGVYCAKVNNNPAILNWGMKPTVNNTQKTIVEVHIIDFGGDLYGKNITIEILQKIRDEKKFENIEELKIQIEKYKVKCLKL